MKTRTLMKSMICTVFITMFAVGCGTPKTEIATEMETETSLTSETNADIETVTEETESSESEQMTETETETETSTETETINTEEETSQSYEAYAVFTPGDRTIRFVYTNHSPKRGDSIDGQEITAVYLDVGRDFSREERAWSDFNLQDKVDTVIFDSSFANAKPETTRGWFEGCQIKEIKGLQYLNTSEVVDMERMFYGCENLTELDLSMLDTGNVGDMSEMFAGCKNLTTVNLCGLDKKNLTKLEGMFRGCEKLKYIDMSGLDAEDILERISLLYQKIEGINTKEMFADCTSLETIVTDEDWDRYILEGEDMFRGCAFLSGGSTWDSEQTGGSMAKREGGYFTPYYLTVEYLGQALSEDFKPKTVEELLDCLEMDKNHPVYEFQFMDEWHERVRHYYIYQNEGIFLVINDGVADLFLMNGKSLPEGILNTENAYDRNVHEMVIDSIPSIDPIDPFSFTDGDGDWLKRILEEQDMNGAFSVVQEQDGVKRLKHVRNGYANFEVEYTFWGNRNIKTKSVHFSQETIIRSNMFFDKQERLLFARNYRTSGEGLEFWVYEKEKPSLYFYIHKFAGDFLGVKGR